MKMSELITSENRALLVFGVASMLSMIGSATMVREVNEISNGILFTPWKYLFVFCLVYATIRDFTASIVVTVLSMFVLEGKHFFVDRDLHKAENNTRNT